MSTEPETPEAIAAEIPETPEEAIQHPPGFVGQLEEGEAKLINSLRQSTNQVVMEIGQLEIRKARLLGAFEDMEARAKQVLGDAALRFGVTEEDCTWTVTPDGRMFVQER